MEILSFGYKRPETSDVDFFDYFTFNIQRLNDHSHDGQDSAKLAVTSRENTEQIISGTWSASGSYYRTLVTMPADHEFDHCQLKFTYNDEVIYPKIERLSSNSYYLYSPYDGVTIKAYYG